MNVLLIGSSFSAMPMLFDLKRRGMHVTVIGKHRDDPCHSYADQSIYEDYSNRDTLLNVCREAAFDYIVPSCNDYSYVAGAFVADLMGFSGFDSPETTSILHTKNRFRQFCQAIGIPAPRIYGEVSAASRDLPVPITGPALVKPVDSFSGRGVRLVREASELSDAIDWAFDTSRQKGAVIEQFVQGHLHSHTAFIANGQIVWHDYVDEFCEVYSYQVDRSIYPSRLSNSIRAAVNESIIKIVASLQLCDGLLHTQFIASDSEFWIIECMRRCPGDLYGQHFKMALGYNYESQYVASFVGQLPEPPNKVGRATRIERRVISVGEPRAFFGLRLQAGEQKVTYVPLKGSGGLLEAAPFDKAGIVFLEGGHPVGVGALGSAHTTIVAYD
jgi:formate-dependent phosphoribosylglycinamide formyltransferase (GAR transformylase)